MIYDNVSDAVVDDLVFTVVAVVVQFSIVIVVVVVIICRRDFELSALEPIISDRLR